MPHFPLCSPGGNVHIHYHEEKCYEDEIFFYHLACHQWVSSYDLAPPISQGESTCVLPGKWSLGVAETHGLTAEQCGCFECTDSPVVKFNSGQDSVPLNNLEKGRSYRGAVCLITVLQGR